MSQEPFPPLTQTVQKGGCAAKISARDLRQILSNAVLPFAPPELLVGTDTFDDAAIYQLNQNSALVQTLDFFTPIVDSPRLFGHIAAANALSDVYAMGGRPLTAMAILAFPVATLPLELASDVISGAGDALREAQIPLVGGHSIDDDTLKFGLSVTGLVQPERVWSNRGARPGDKLLLTKPIGTGTITAALKRREIRESEMVDAIRSMTTLNRMDDLLSEKARRAVHGATDITGFGLLGHASHIAKASLVDLSFRYSSIPCLDGANDFLRRGFVTKAHRTNREYVHEILLPDPALTDEELLLLLDPQTSGGLLMAVEASLVDEILESIRPRFPHAAVVGEVSSVRESAPMLRVKD